MRRSIRVELPQSYAAIALLAAVALGAVLLLILRDYYGGLEQQYLAGQAEVFGPVLAQLLEDDLPQEALQAQLTSLSFLSQARVRLLDTDAAALADSNTPGTFDVALAALPQRDLLVVAEEGQGASVAGGVIAINPSPAGASVVSGTLPTRLEVKVDNRAGPSGPYVIQSLSVAGGAFPSPDGEAQAAGPRSRRSVRRPIYSPAAELLGYVELSEGPAYGREIVASVARGWALAGAVAVLLAAAVGWLVSRRISAPLLALSRVTEAMAQGDLSARASVARRDEFGALGRSYNQMAERVESTVLALRRFASDAAHELRTPLATLRTNLEMMQEAEAGQGERLARAQAQVERLEALTSGLLDLSRLEAGTNGPPLEKVSLTALVQEVAELYASQAEQAGLAFELDLPEEPVSVRGDPAQLRRALSNLLDNAVKFTPEGGHLSLGLWQEGGTAEVWVEDTGIGVPEEEIPSLFQRFHRGRNSAAYPGSGLGLAIVKAIADRHGGQVAVQRTHQGTTFRLYLPSV